MSVKCVQDTPTIPPNQMYFQDSKSQEVVVIFTTLIRKLCINEVAIQPHSFLVYYHISNCYRKTTK